MAGHRMLDMAAEGMTATFDVEEWASATYIVIVRTRHGATVHRLVVKAH